MINISEEFAASILSVEGSRFIGNTGTYLPDYTASNLRRPLRNLDSLLRENFPSHIHGDLNESMAELWERKTNV
jgi:hypothetical protein